MLAISNALTIHVSICYKMVELAIIQSGLALDPPHLLEIKGHHRGLGFNARFFVPLPSVLMFVTQKLHTFIVHLWICLECVSM